MGTRAILDMWKVFQKLAGLTSPADIGRPGEPMGRPRRAIPVAGSILV